MGLLTPEDRAQMKADFVQVRADNEFQCILRRGNTELPPQPARIAIVGNIARERDSRSSEQWSSPQLLLMAYDADVLAGDRFTHDGKFYKVVLLRPNTLASRVCEVEEAQ